MKELKELLPGNYVRFEELGICSNWLIDGQVPIRMKDHFLVLVGKKDEVPLVWLSATKDGKEWELVVDGNQSRSDAISVSFPKEGNSVLIMTGSTIIVHAVKLSEIRAEIDTLDLRPLGFDFHGNKAGLYVGTNLFEGNRFQGIAVMIDIG